jgi:CDGSH iron-sulfur domain-containing protein 3
MPAIAQKAPYKTALEAGKKYAWCACGLSKAQPLCDGSHKGSGLSPIVFTADATKEAYLCGCKHSKNGAMCDGTHKSL